jgi:hypothetical protein
MNKKLGARTFRHSLETSRKFLVAHVALDTLGPAPATGTPWGLLYEKATGDTAWLGMLANGPDPDNPPQEKDGLGDCVICDDLRAIALWTALGDCENVKPTTPDAIALYEQITGFNPADPNSDQGTEPSANAKYMQATGWADSAGRVHKLDGWAPLDPTNRNHIAWALQAFGCVKFAIAFPDFAETQFDNNQPWDFSGQSYQIEGGHDIICVGYAPDGYQVVSWGRRFLMTYAFAAKFLDTIIAPVSSDFIRANGTAPNLLNLDQMLADLAATGS